MFKGKHLVIGILILAIRLRALKFDWSPLVVHMNFDLIISPRAQCRDMSIVFEVSTETLNVHMYVWNYGYNWKLGNQNPLLINLPI